MKKYLSLLLCIICIAAVCVMMFRLEEDRQAQSTTVDSAATDTVTEWQASAGSTYKFYYKKLSDIEKEAYDDILSEIYSMPETIIVPRITAEQLDAVFSALLYDNPDLFFVGRKCTLITEFFRVRCSVEYICDFEEYTQRKQELDAVCEEVISSLSNPEDEWQTELEIHDYIVENCEYKLVENEHIYSSAYGALVNGKAACEGYSKAAKLLFDKVGIESAVVSGVSSSDSGTPGAHMWNAVKINGDYYYLDCTWDDPLSEDGKNVKIYSYFNLNDDMIASTHSEFSHDFGCTAAAENYYIKKGRFFEEYDRSCEDAVAQIIADELNDGGDAVEIRFGSADTFNSAVEDLIEGGRIYDVLSLTRSKTKVKFSHDSLSYYSDPDSLTLTIVPERR